MVASANGHVEGIVLETGFRVPPETFRLTFPEDSPWHGAIVRCYHYASVARALAIDEAVAERRRHDLAQAGAVRAQLEAAEAGEDPPESGITPAAQRIYEQLDLFAEQNLAGWNLRQRVVDPEAPWLPDADGIPAPNYVLDEGGAEVWEPLPATVAGLHTLPFEFAFAILLEFSRRKFQTESPLSPPSPATPPPASSTPEAASSSPSTPKRVSRSKSPPSLPEP